MCKVLTTEVLDAVGRGASLEELSVILQQYKDGGGSQEDALKTLDAIRAEVDEQTEDKVLDAMDVAAGWCAPRLRIW